MNEEMRQAPKAGDPGRPASMVKTVFAAICALAAWGSLFTPIAVAFLLLGNIPYKRDNSWQLEWYAQACGVGLAVGAVSVIAAPFLLRGARFLLALPAALLGIVLNVAVGVVAYLFLAATGFAG